MELTFARALHWGTVLLFVFSCQQVFELKTKLRMLQDIKYVLHPELKTYSEYPTHQ